MSIKIILNDDRLWYQLFWSHVLIYSIPCHVMTWLDMIQCNVLSFAVWSDVMWYASTCLNCVKVLIINVTIFCIISIVLIFSLHSFHFLPQLAFLYLIIFYLAIPYLILPYLNLPYLTLPYPILSYLILPYPILTYLILPYLILPYLTLSYLTLTYLTLSYLILSSFI